ncbi:putative glyoxalase superfamily protein PhnB [Catenulispora sp. EB89]|uniref:VOC family protein n=1 Tax=Catenulispora sp. EB89 TaxID=3156257 RepID=UPI00351857CA
MNFASTRVITADITALVAFYEKATTLAATWFTPDFAELAGPAGATLAIGSTSTVPLFAAGSAAPAANRSVILEFLVDDVDTRWQELAAWIPGSDVVAEPKTMPWGNRSLLVRDPDGNLVNFFTPVTPEARATFGL